MVDLIWEFFIKTLITMFFPLVCIYHSVAGNLFLNSSIENAQGLEYAGDVLLAPFQYVFGGHIAIPQEDGSWRFVQRYEYNDLFWTKTVCSLTTLPVSVVLGSAVKGLSFLSSEVRARHASLAADRHSTQSQSHADLYKKLGIHIGQLQTAPFLESQGYQRRPGDERHMHTSKECLAEIAKLLNEAGIPWWADCGTLLGAYRYGGIIPWDYDIDIGILALDFENVRKVLGRLDKTKYLVQDWSGRNFPDTFLKIYIRESDDLIDVYCYAVDEEKRELSYILSIEDSLFFPEQYKKDEARYKVPVSFDVVFPLKRGHFDGLEIAVPADTKAFLQRYPHYGQNLAPVKILNPLTNQFEKDPSHPYWQHAASN